WRGVGVAAAVVARLTAVDDAVAAGVEAHVRGLAALLAGGAGVAGPLPADAVGAGVTGGTEEARLAARPVDLVVEGAGAGAIAGVGVGAGVVGRVTAGRPCAHEAVVRASAAAVAGVGHDALAPRVTA